MSYPHGTKFKVRTYPSGKRVKQAILNGRVIGTKDMPRIKQTKTRRALKKRRRRIGRR